MNSGINLLIKREDVNLKEKKRIRVLRIVASVFLGITLLSSLALIILYNQLDLAEIKRDQESTVKNISSLHEKSAKLTATNDRIRNITQILKTRKDFQQIINEVLKQATSGIAINGMDISEEGINIKVSSSSLYDVKVFIDKMIAIAEGKKVIKDLKIDSLYHDIKNDKYNLVISSNLL